MLDLFIEKAEQRFDAMVSEGSDQELFVSSYLHGHFDLVISQVLAQGKDNVEALDQQMQQSLQQAFDNNELAEPDQQQVRTFWQQILTDASAA